MQNIILISGKQASGKTTLAKQITYSLPKPYAAHHVKFAGALYEMHEAIWNIMLKYGYNRETEKDGRLLQLLGTEWGRQHIDEDIWAKLCRSKVDMIMNNYKEGYEDIAQPIVIIDDSRFKNEFHMFPEALRVRLECPESIRQERCSSWRNDTQHPSETDLDEIALNGKFDLYFHTDRQSPQEIAEVVLKQALNAN